MEKFLDLNGLKRLTDYILLKLAKKQDKLTGTQGQVVGFDAAGNPEAQSTAGLVGPQGADGAAAGFGTPTASVDANVGTPSVTVTTSGPNTAKVFNFAFKNLKGAKGDKGDPGLHFGTCATASSTAAKVVALSGFTLTTGAVVAVKFTNTNTASSPTLNVNETGAKSIVKYGLTAPTAYMWQAGELVEFVYDGTYWVMVRGGLATTTYYGLTKLSSSVTSTSTALAATPSAVKSAYDLANAALPKSGGTMTGALSVLTPTADTHAATKAYVDNLHKWTDVTGYSIHTYLPAAIDCWQPLKNIMLPEAPYLFYIICNLNNKSGYATRFIATGWIIFLSESKDLAFVSDFTATGEAIPAYGVENADAKIQITGGASYGAIIFNLVNNPYFQEFTLKSVEVFKIKPL